MNINLEENMLWSLFVKKFRCVYGEKKMTIMLIRNLSMTVMLIWIQTQTDIEEFVILWEK